MLALCVCASVCVRDKERGRMRGAAGMGAKEGGGCGGCL